MPLPETWTNPRDGSVLRLIPMGTFTMGSTPEDIEAATCMDKEGPEFGLRHETPQFQGWTPLYFIGVYPVTNEQYARFLSEARPVRSRLDYWLPWNERIAPPDSMNRSYRVVPGFQRHPVVNVSWYGAQAYCEWAGLRLPTEIEWEKAARGTDGRLFPWGSEWRPDALCWWSNRGRDETTAPVDAFPEGRSPYGLYQMAGNAEEWCADWYQPDVYQRYATGDLRPSTHGVGRVARGGACLRRNRLEFRCAMRRANPPALVNILYTGIRCAADVDTIAKQS